MRFSARHRRVPGFALVVALIMGLLMGPSVAHADAGPPEAPPAAADLDELIRAARSYFDLEAEQWRGRKHFVAELSLAAQKGTFHLKDMEALRWLIAQSRSFAPDLRERKWQAKAKVEGKAAGGTLYTLRGQTLDCTFSLPDAYPSARRLSSRLPRSDPLPTLLLMHDTSDRALGQAAGKRALARLWPREDFGWLYDEWLAIAPHAPATGWLNNSMLRTGPLLSPFAAFWRSYHVDFDRIFLDGGAGALAAASSQGIYFAGIILRGGQLDTDAARRTVRNFAHIPVFVVGQPALAAALRAAGHPRVTAGAPALLREWMEAQERRTPKEFHWTVASAQYVLPYWLNLDEMDRGATDPTLHVKVVDREKKPNTICIDARGIRRLSLFLSDDLVDLDRPVRVEINGHVVHAGMVAMQDDATEDLGRDFDTLFDRSPVRIRQSMFFGFLAPARLVQLQVRMPTEPTTCAGAAARPPPPPAVDSPAPAPGAAPASEAPEPARPPIRADDPEPEAPVDLPEPLQPSRNDPRPTSLVPVGLPLLLLLLLLGLLWLVARRRRDRSGSEGR